MKIIKFNKNPIEKSYRKKSESVGDFPMIVSENVLYQ